MRRGVIAALVLSSVSSWLWAEMGTAAPRPGRHAHPDRSDRTQKGVASFYSHKAAGKTMASGRPLALNRMTAASPTLPLGTKAKVVNSVTGKSAHVTVTDRGPYAKGRVIDLTPKAAEQLGMKEKGVAPVEVKPVSEPTSPKKK